MSEMWRKKLMGVIKYHGYTNKKVAEGLGISPCMIGHILSGRRDPSLSNLDNICKYLNITISDLLNDNISDIRPTNIIKFSDHILKINKS